MVLLLVIVGGLAFTMWFRPETADPSVLTAQTDLTGGQTALAALATADKQAETWQADAQLLKATASWSARDGLPYSSGRASWAFTYYSPSETAVAQITVADDQASPPLISQADIPLTLMDSSGGWRINSPQAVEQIMAHGGSEFLSGKSDTSISLSLSTVSVNGRMEWLVSLFDEQSDDFMAMRLDATSGEVLEIIQKP